MLQVQDVMNDKNDLRLSFLTQQQDLTQKINSLQSEIDHAYQDMIIEENTRAMIDGLKDLHQYQQQDSQVSVLSQRLLDCETASIRQMQSFL